MDRRDILEQAGLQRSTPVPSGILFVAEEPDDETRLAIYGTLDLVPYQYTLRNGRRSGVVTIYVPSGIAGKRPQEVGAWIRRNSERVTRERRARSLQRAWAEATEPVNVERAPTPPPAPSQPASPARPRRAAAPAPAARAAPTESSSTPLDDVRNAPSAQYISYAGKKPKPGRVRGQRAPRLLRQFNKERYLTAIKPVAKTFRQKREAPQTTIKRLCAAAARQVRELHNILEGWARRHVMGLNQRTSDTLPNYAVELNLRAIVGVDRLDALVRSLAPIMRIVAPLDAVGDGLTAGVQMRHRIQTLVGTLVIEGIKTLLLTMLSRANTFNLDIIPVLQPQYTGTGAHREINVTEAFLANMDALNPFVTLERNLRSKAPIWQVGAEFFNSFMTNPFMRLEEMGSDSYRSPIQFAPIHGEDVTYNFRIKYRTLRQPGARRPTRETQRRRRPMYRSQTRRREPTRQRSAPYFHTIPGLDLTRFQIYSPESTKEQLKQAGKPCFLHVAEASGLFTADELNYMYRHCRIDTFQRTQWEKLARTLGFNIVIRSVNRQMHVIMDFMQSNVTRTLKLVEADGHVMLNERVPVTKAALNDLEGALAQGRLDVVPFNDGWITVPDYRCLSLTAFLTHVRQRGIAELTPEFTLDHLLAQPINERPLLVAISIQDELAKRALYLTSNLLTHEPGNLPPPFGAELVEPPPENPRPSSHRIFFGDFEATTDGEYHKPYLFCLVGSEGFYRSHYEQPAAPLLAWTDALNRILAEAREHVRQHDPENAEQPLYVYFHNLNYDRVFLMQALGQYCDGTIVDCGNRVFGFKIFRPRFGSVSFHCSYAHIAYPLSAFGKNFDLPVEKELMPYTFYSEAVMPTLTKTYDIAPRQASDGTPLPKRTCLAPFADFLAAMEPADKRAELERRVRAYQPAQGMRPWLHVRHGVEYIDAIEYAEYYCRRDCEVLAQGFTKYREDMWQFCGLELTAFYTGPSIAYGNMRKRGVFDECYNLVGEPLKFIRQGVLGGRCMMARNEKQHVREDPSDPMLAGGIQDFDAVSLYPSAMHLLWTVKGLPKIIPPGTTFADLWAEYQAGRINDFFVRVHVSEVPKALDFPLIAHHLVVNGQKKLRYLNEPVEDLYCSQLTVENLMMFHQVPVDAFVLVEGYYYDEGRNYKIREVIEDMFERRLHYKAQGAKGLDSVCKLAMNSSYGKSIMKPRYTEHLLVSEEQMCRRIRSGNNTVTTDVQIVGSDNYILTSLLPYDSMKAFPTFGVQILEMSKRIMSEVMCLAQDIGVPVYYTDTDSMHLPANGVTLLEAAFRERYGRELIGKAMGQFHCDFEVSGKKGDWVSREFIAVGKKAYMDVLRDATGTHGDQVFLRMKGIPNEALLCHAGCDVHPESAWPDLVRALYLRLYAGGAEEIDILRRMDGTTRASFMVRGGVTQTRPDGFFRRVCFPDDDVADDVEDMGDESEDDLEDDIDAADEIEATE